MIDVGSIVTQGLYRDSNGCDVFDVGIVVSIRERVGARHLLTYDGPIVDIGIQCPYGVFLCFWKLRPKCNVIGSLITTVTFSSKTVSR